MNVYIFDFTLWMARFSMHPMSSALLNAPLLFFVLGLVSRVVRSDLRVPRALSKALSIYLLAGIGLHGGAQLAKADIATLLAPSLAALGLACLLPLIAYATLRRVLGLDGFNAAAISAHYGSVSVATFLAAGAWLTANDIAHEPATVLMLAIMVLVLIVGTALDFAPTLMILTPVLMPIVTKAGIDPVYFGVLFIMANAIGLVTPPVGIVLNVVSGVGKVSLTDVTRGLTPFLIALTGVLLLLVAFPALVLVPMKWFL